MKLKKFTIDPVDQQHLNFGNYDSVLKGASHVETYTIDENKCGGKRTLIIFAFYPDDHEDDGS